MAATRDSLKSSEVLLLQETLNTIQEITEAFPELQRTPLVRSMGLLYLMLGHRLIDATGGFGASQAALASGGGFAFRLGTTISDGEQMMIEETYREAGTMEKAAKLLGVTERTLIRKMKQYRASKGAADRQPRESDKA